MSPDFAAAIARDGRYLVFITPEDDVRGVFVTGRSAAGFYVRETSNGRSNATFAYRIVARPAGTHAAIRFPLSRAQTVAR